MTLGRATRSAVAGLVLAVMLLGGQAVSDARVATTATSSAGAVVGRASFAYLTGLRRFAAVLLWSRLEPQFHEFYGGVPLSKQLYFLPNARLITLLDPQFVQAYDIAPWILLQNGRLSQAIGLAREGVRNNPHSGVLHTSLAQILYLRTKDRAGAIRQADLAVRPDEVWLDAVQQWQSLTLIADIYTHSGLPDKAAQALAITRQLDKDLGGAPGFRDPDTQF